MFLISSFVLDRVPFRSFPSVNSPSFFFQFFVFDLLQLFQYLDLSLHCTQLHSWSHSHSPVSTSNRVDPFNYFHLNLLYFVLNYHCCSIDPHTFILDRNSIYNILCLC
eukprot:240560_1